MDKSIAGMLNDTEQALLREVEPRRLKKLDEDGLIELHQRIRRARNKYSKLYRRRSAEQVTGDASRARAHRVHERTSIKAEAFEEALATVSDRLATVAQAAADQLKAERLAAAKGSGSRPPAKRAGTGKAKAAAAKTKRRTPQKKRASASAKAATKRKEAKRASR